MISIDYNDGIFSQKTLNFFIAILQYKNLFHLLVHCSICYYLLSTKNKDFLIILSHLALELSWSKFQLSIQMAVFHNLWDHQKIIWIYDEKEKNFNCSKNEKACEIDISWTKVNLNSKKLPRLKRKIKMLPNKAKKYEANDIFVDETYSTL